jgi:hypothetical protein
MINHFSISWEEGVKLFQEETENDHPLFDYVGINVAMPIFY